VQCSCLCARVPWLEAQTAQLDGETNLKLRRAPDCVFDRFETDVHCLAFNGRVRCEEPTEHFGRFTAFIYPDADSDQSYPLNADNTLLRGCVLRNVEYVYGLVVYTGDQTKVGVLAMVSDLLLVRRDAHPTPRAFPGALGCRFGSNSRPAVPQSLAPLSGW
jgi:magnesium-transporting ATPase (P-type)